MVVLLVLVNLQEQVGDPRHSWIEKFDPGPGGKLRLVTDFQAQKEISRHFILGKSLYRLT